MRRAGEGSGSRSESGHNIRQPVQYINLAGSDHGLDGDVELMSDGRPRLEGSSTMEHRHPLHSRSDSSIVESYRHAFESEGPPGYDSSGEGEQITLAEALASTESSHMPDNYRSISHEAPPRYSRHGSLPGTASGKVIARSGDLPPGSSTTALEGRVPAPETSSSTMHTSTAADRSRYYPYPSASFRQNTRNAIFRQRSEGDENSGNGSSARRGQTTAFIGRRGSTFSVEAANRSEFPRDAIESVQAESVVPRWQPDAEVTYCPICHSQFTWVSRKHHCRKCGRVVCNSCSPHRIVIPHRYIAHPPSAISNSNSQGSRAGSASVDQAPRNNNPDLVGGDRVRLCNPCVPDPNVAPPQVNQNEDPSYTAPRHSRSVSSTAASPTSGVSGRPSRHLYDHIGGVHRRSRQDTYRAPMNVSSPQLSTPESRSRSSTHTGAPPGPLDDIHTVVSSIDPRSLASRPYLSQSASTSRATLRAMDERPLPRPPRLAEEDECPVCHQELPSSSLPNSDDRRAAHISSCIENSVAGSSNSVPNPNPFSPPTSSSSSVVTSISIQGSHNPHLPAGSGSRAGGTRAIRRSGVFPYRATEKDCIDEAECTICLEEYEVGVEMGRLECFCRFHLRCIREWFRGRPGMCPVHQYDVG